MEVAETGTNLDAGWSVSLAHARNRDLDGLLDDRSDRCDGIGYPRLGVVYIDRLKHRFIPCTPTPIFIHFSLVNIEPTSTSSINNWKGYLGFLYSTKVNVPSFNIE